MKPTYKSAGVDIKKADGLIKKTKKNIASTKIKGCISAIGGFNGLFDIRSAGYKDPLLVACADGVGTKLKVAIDTGKHDTVGIDLVAMNVNDCICSGAQPLFFLDYYASGKLSEKVWPKVIKGIVEGCKNSGCALLGGETAEMPGMYKTGDYDLAGFCIGAVERKNVITGKKIKPGDVVLGLASSGLHSNGFSLVHKIFTKKEIKKEAALFIKPTRIYVRQIIDLMKKHEIKGISHITGGGFYDNIPRILPSGVAVNIKRGSWNIPKVFKKIIAKGLVEKELYRTFNMGIGMVLIMQKKEALKAKEYFKRKYKLSSWIIGEIVKGKNKVIIQ